MSKLNSQSTMLALPEGKVYGNNTHFVCLLPCQRKAIPPVSYSHTNHAWLLALAFCWNLAAISISSVGEYSFTMNISSTGGRLTGWGCYCALAFHHIRGQVVEAFCPLHNHDDIFFFTLLTFPGILPLSVSIKLCHKHSELNPL